MKNAELYQKVTDRIITQLKEGVPPWTRPWKDGQSKGAILTPANVVTGRQYSGINTLLLWDAALTRGYRVHGWLTFQQANNLGANVRKGEKSVPVVFVKRVEKEDEAGDVQKSTIMKTYPVFNVHQLENLPAHYLEDPPPTDEQVIHNNALRLAKECGAKITHGGNKAAYYPQRDEICMPPFGQFDSEADYWGTCFHEVTHWSGAKSRLNRQFGKRFADKAYSFEELVAELGSAFMCARLGIPATFRSASYLDNWLKILGEDNRAIFTAASYANHAANYVFEQAHAVQENTPDVEKQGGDLAA